MTKIILIKLNNILWLITFLTLPLISTSLESNEYFIRKFPYVMSPEPFTARQARDVGEAINNMLKGEIDNENTVESLIQNNSEQQILSSTSGTQILQDQESENSIRSENYQYPLPQTYENLNNVPQQHHNILQTVLENEKQINNVPHQLYNQPHVQQQQQPAQYNSNQDTRIYQQDSTQYNQPQQQNFLSSYSIPPQTYNHLQSIYQNQQYQSITPSPRQYQSITPSPISSQSYNNNNLGTIQNSMIPPYPAKQENLQPPVNKYLPSLLTTISTTPPSISISSTTGLPPSVPTVNITPKPRVPKIYLPPSKPTKSVITNIYSYDAPTELDDDDTMEDEPDTKGRTHYKILFIKAPSQISKKTLRLAHTQHQNQQKTVVYVLTKKTDVGDIRDALQYLPTTTSRPEVHFIRYKTEDEAEHAKHQIQTHYHGLSDSTQYSNEGIPQISSVIGLLPSNVPETPENEYLPPVQQNTEQTYLPPQQTISISQEYLPPSK